MAEIKKAFPIKGMHCASCVKVTERALKKVPGVKEAVVNLATEKATVTYDQDNCTPQ
ncbi:MAG: cation transporter, partial [Candidatus Levybacteria bacterium]|nr:cation transporter [Candidatus Levybacteria bacterium]